MTDSFSPQDEEDKNSWDIGAPLFENFFIIGPNEKDQMKTLYFYPYAKKNDQDYSKLLTPSGYKLEPKCFKNLREVKLEFANENKIIENLVFYKVDGGHPLFLYATIFEATPFSYPAITKPYVLDNLFQYQKKYDKVPCFKCGFVFLTKHPFHKLFFGLLKTFIQLEYQARNTKQNLSLLSSKLTRSFIPDQYWPCTTMLLRRDFLDSLYKLSLPSFEEWIGIKFNLLNAKEFRWQMPSTDMMPFCPAQVGYSAIMTWINAEDFIRLLEFTLLGESIVVFGSDYSSITKAVSFIPQIIMPFSWSSNVISFVTDEAKYTFGVPGTAIYGTFHEIFDSYLEEFQDETVLDSVFVELDEKTIKFPEMKERLPLYDELLAAINPLFQGESTDFSLTMAILQLCQKHLFHNITKKMEAALECRLDVENPGTMFHEDIYNKQFHEEDLPFIKRLEDSQNFMCLVSKLCRIQTQLKLGEYTDNIGNFATNILKLQNPNMFAKKSPAQLLNVFDPDN